MGLDASKWDCGVDFYIPRPPAGESILQAKVVRFVGRSWMPATEDHRLLCSRVAPGKNEPGVEQLLLENARPGTRLPDREDVRLKRRGVDPQIVLRDDLLFHVGGRVVGTVLGDARRCDCIS